MPDLRSIIADLCRRAGFDPDLDVDLTGIAGRIPGLTLSRRSTVRACLETLQQAFPFDAVESGGQVCFRPRGGDVAAVLSAEDLIPFAEGSLVEIVRGRESELPRQVDVLYASTATDFQTSCQTARRLAGGASSAVSVELPLSLDDDVARRIAERLLYQPWLERDAYAFQLDAEHALLEPADIVELALGGRTVRLRVIAVEANATVFRIRAVPDDAELLGSASTGGRPGARLSSLRVVPPTVLFALDLPPLRDQDDGPGWYAAASFDAAAGGSWPGAVLMKSLDGTAYDRFAALRGPATWGVCETVLGDGPCTHWDEVSRLTVRLANGSLESRDRASVLNGANAALVGDEIVQFRQAELTAADTYRLSGLLRGRRGTEHLTAGHAAGETFLLLTTFDLSRIVGQQEAIGAVFWLKAVTAGLYAEDQPAESFADTGASLRPFSVAHPRASRDPQSGDVSLAWVRRARVLGGWIDGADVPLVEADERYEVDVVSGSGAVLRTLSSTGPSAVYTAAMQAADAGAGAAFRIHQISAVVGRGVPREITI